MFLGIILSIISIGISLTVFFLSSWWTTWYFYLVTILMAFGIFFLLFWVTIFIFGLAMHKYQGSSKDYPPNRFYQYLMGEVCLLCRLFCRVKFIKSGFENIPKEPCMIISNHLSDWDHISLIAEFRHRNMVCINKKVLSTIFLIGGIIKKAGYISIIQKDIKDGNRCIELGASYIKNGTSVCVAPEGTRNKDFPDPWLLPFKPGTFNLAMLSKSPIVVISIQNTNAVSARFPLHRTQVYADVVGVLRYEEYKDLSLAEIAAKTQKLIQDKFEEKEARFYHLRPKK